MHEQIHVELKVLLLEKQILQKNIFYYLSDTINFAGSLFSCNKIVQKKIELFKPFRSQNTSKYFASTEAKTRK